MALNTITRREKLYAKICWPQIDTQRTKFRLVDATTVVFPTWGVHPGRLLQASELHERLQLETVETRWWIAVGKRISVKARWAYSERVDTVFIRSFATALTALMDVPSTWEDGWKEAQP